MHNIVRSATLPTLLLAMFLVSTMNCSESRGRGTGHDGQEGESEGSDGQEGQTVVEGQGEGAGEGEGTTPKEGEGAVQICDDRDEDEYGLGPGCKGTDCDDNDATVHPGADDVCNDLKDNNCDGETDEGCGRYPNCDDTDRDGFGIGSGCLGKDCDDNDAGVYPDAREFCDDRKDNDCDGQTDENCGAGGHGTGCDTMYNCISDCGDDQVCGNVCQAKGSQRARALYLTMMRCFMERCADSSDYDFQLCAESECSTQIDACFQDT